VDTVAGLSGVQAVAGLYRAFESNDMTEGDFLDEAFSEQSSEPAEAVETVEATEPQPEQAPVRDERGRFAPKGEQEGVSPAPVEAEEPPFDHAAVKGERKRRQEAEARIAALEAQLQSLQQPKAEPEPVPSIWDDDQAALAHNRQQAVSEASFNARLDMSEMLASQAHEDFQEVQAKFNELAHYNPLLAKQALESKHPWEAAYQIAKNAMKAEEFGASNVSELEAKIEARIKAELEAQKPAVTIPTTLADHQSMRGGAAPAATGPLTSEDVLGRR
jgi:hypothetical protein